MTTPRRIWEILTPRGRRHALYLLCLIVIGGMLETLSIGLVVPALALLTEPDLSTRYPALAPLFNWLGNPTQRQVAIGGMLMLVAVYLLKSVVLGTLAWWQARFAFGLQASLSQRIFSGYLRQPYAFHLQRNSGEMIHTAIGKVAGLEGAIQQSFMFVAEGLVLAGIAGLLLIMEPLGAAVVVTVLGLAGLAFSRGTRSHILRWGRARQTHEERRVQELQQGLGSVKDIKLLGREAVFLKRYEYHTTASARAGALQATLIALPRSVLELLAVAGVASLALIMLKQDRSPDAIVPVLGLFAAAAFRIMPSVVRLLAGVQAVLYLQPVIEILHREIKLLEGAASPPTGAPLPLTDRLDVEGVSYRYPNSSVPALSEVTLSIRRGESVGIVGSSGAGKSTLVDLMLGLLTPTHGRICVDGTDIQSHVRGWQDEVGYVPQSIFLTDDTIRSNVAFGIPAEDVDDAAVWQALSAAQLDTFVAGLSAGLDATVGERGVRLSGGQRQRIGIARALYHNPSVLVLDEATSSLDTQTEAGVIEAVRVMEGTRTIIIVAHRLSTVQHCVRLYTLEGGRLVEPGRMLEGGSVEREMPQTDEGAGKRVCP